MAVGQTTLRLEHWLNRLRAGDPAARGQLVTHAYERLRLLAHQMLGGFPTIRPLSEATDVLHGALIRLDQALDEVQIDSVAGFFRLAATQIRRELIDLYRHYYGPQRHATRQVGEACCGEEQLEWALLETPDSQGGPATGAAQRELKALVHECVEQLHDDQRHVVDLLMYVGLTQEESAEVLGVSVPTVKRRWRTARVQLGRLLKARGLNP